MGTSRRQFLNVGLGGALLLSASGWLRFRFAASTPALVFDAQQRKTASALAAAFIDTPAPFPSHAAIDTVGRMEAVISKLDADSRREVLQLFDLFDHPLTNAAWGAKATRFGHQSVTQAQETLRRWRDSSISLRKTGYRALRSLTMAAYYSDPRTSRAVGYPGPPFIPTSAEPLWKGRGQPRPPSLGRE